MAGESTYDDLPYRAFPIEWTAPERLSLVSRLHGGPRTTLQNYRVLEIGCANGANLLPMAWYRPHGSFVGIDNSRRQVDEARARARSLALDNVRFHFADVARVGDELDGRFDYIVCHGVFSWVDPATRDAMLRLFAQRLAPGGLLYLNYNAHPGWAIRGLIRKFLLAQTAKVQGLLARAEAARSACARMLDGLDDDPDHPYRQLLVDELKFAGEWDLSYLAHEYLAEHNHAYWRSEVLAMAEAHGLGYVADADFNYAYNDDHNARDWLESERLHGWSLDDAVDFVRYRQLHSPVFTPRPYTHAPLTVEELADLHVASCLAPADEPTEHLVHPNGFRVEVSEPQVRSALLRLQTSWPRALQVREAFTDVASVHEDLPLLYRNRLIELRSVEPSDDLRVRRLHELEAQWGGYRTSPYHQWEPAEP